MARIQVTPEELIGYRPIPGYSRSKTDRLPDRPDGTYSIATKGRTSRRFYNPAMDPADPRREIGDATYYTLRRQMAQAPAPEAQEGARQAKARLHQFQERKAHTRELDRLQAQQSNMDPDLFMETRRQIGVYSYTHGIFQQDRQPGGYLATLLEELGWRPRGAPWMVGESGSDHSRTAPSINPSASMTAWKSQSSTRGRVA